MALKKPRVDVTWHCTKDSTVLNSFLTSKDHWQYKTRKEKRKILATYLKFILLSKQTETQDNIEKNIIA